MVVFQSELKMNNLILEGLVCSGNHESKWSKSLLNDVNVAFKTR